MTKLYIPSDVMPIIVMYLDMKDRARMAQVNKAWNKCMYRNCMWGDQRWNPHPGMIETVLHLPKTALHIGSAYKACFFYWLNSQRIILAKPIQEYYYDWKKEGSPCLYTCHHRFEDTLIATRVYKELSPEKQAYVFHRFAYLQIDEHAIDRYSLLLRSIIKEFEYILATFSITSAPPPQTTSTITDLYRLFHHESQTMLHTHDKQAHAYIQHYIKLLHGCIHALKRHGPTDWNLNEIAYARDPLSVWESVAFQLN